MATKKTRKTFETFDLALEFRIAALPQRVFRALLHESSNWFPEDFYTGATPLGFVFEPRVGGQGYEDWGDGQGQVWFTVTGLQRDEYLQLSGTMGGDYGPVTFVTTFRLSRAGSGTLLNLTDCHWGIMHEGKAEAMASGWRRLLGEALRNWVEKGVRPKLPPTVLVGKAAKVRKARKAGR
jgi:uncharacterized protein YndB with AHSA1/START domain